MGLIIDKDFLKTVKSATSIVFRYNVVNIIECYFGNLTNETVTTYDIPENVYKNNINKAFFMIHCSQYAKDFQSILSVLKAGDEIELLWKKDYHTNQYLEKARLHADVLLLMVIRGKNKEKRLEFEICTSICPQNTARMIDPDKSYWEN